MTLKWNENINAYLVPMRLIFPSNKFHAAIYARFDVVMKSRRRKCDNGWKHGAVRYVWDRAKNRRKQNKTQREKKQRTQDTKQRLNQTQWHNKMMNDANAHRQGRGRFFSLSLSCFHSTHQHCPKNYLRINWKVTCRLYFSTRMKLHVNFWL